MKLQIETTDVHWLAQFLKDCINHNKFPGCDDKPLTLPTVYAAYFGSTDRYSVVRRIVGVCEQLEKEMSKPPDKKGT